FTVERLVGREAISEAPVFDLEVSSATAMAGVRNACLGRAARLSVPGAIEARWWAGVIASVTGRGLSDDGSQFLYGIRFASRLGLLHHRVGSRIFQDLSLEEIVGDVAGRVLVETEWNLERERDALEYCTQYEETDFDFLRRILAEDGIGFYPRYGARDSDTETFSCIDAAVMYGVVRAPAGDDPARLTFAPSVSATHNQENVATAFEVRSSLRPDAAELRAFDPERPQTPVIGRATHTADHGGVQLPPGEGEADEAIALEIYEHQMRFARVEWEEVERGAELVLERYGRDRMMASGSSVMPWMAAGHRFALEQHSEEVANREWMLTRVTHEWSKATESESPVYRNHFECIPSEVAYRPPLTGKRPRLSTLTATVVGPEGTEIHTDEQGRIQVEFHWDRRQKGEDASCWVRTMQNWSGVRWGSQFIPRVAMEVVVGFDGGDPDRPLVLGAVYNGVNPMGFSPTEEKTVSGFRTQSTPGGGGHHELSFDDASEREKVYLRSQRDFETEVLRDKSLHVHRHDTIQVDGDRRVQVTGTHHVEVRGGGSMVVLGAYQQAVGGAVEQAVAGARTTRIAGRERMEVVGSAEQRYEGDVLTRATGNHTLVVGTHDSPKAALTRVEGSWETSAEGEVVLTAKEAITLRCGTSVLRVTEDAIEVQADELRLVGQTGRLIVNGDGVQLSGDGSLAHFTDKVAIRTEQSGLAMGTEVKVDASKILLNSPVEAVEEPPEDPEPPTEIELVDQHGQPIAGQAFVIELADGTTRGGVTDHEGKATIELAEDGEIRFPGLTSPREA
ncbi:MAG: type VI secretion system tip protein TssI/VgrG, partial [Myxococcota bacterium]